MLAHTSRRLRALLIFDVWAKQRKKTAMLHKFRDNRCVFCGVSLAISGYSEHCRARKSDEERETMSLITCYDCGKKISSLASACPSCGAPARAKKQTNEEFIASFREVLYPTPRCPVCTSPMLSELGPLSRMMEGGVFAAAKRHKCNNCGHLF